MSSLPCNAGAVPFFPAQDFEQKRAAIFKHIAGSNRLAEVRPASGLEVRPRPEMLSTGIPEIDAMSGGIPRGCLSEMYGAASSGKTSALLAVIASATRRHETCVLIDASDSFDPESGAAAGVDFGKLLWVRCGGSRSSAVDPRSSTHNVNADERRSMNDDFVSKRQKSNESKLEQVLKTTDLVLQSGGFGLVVLDLAGVPEKFVRRIPLASWFRFQRAVEHTKTALLVMSEFACAQTCAAVVVRLGNQLSVISSQQSGKPSHAQLLEKMRVEAEVVRMRLERKPAASVRTVFATKAVRAG